MKYLVFLLAFMVAGCDYFSNNGTGGDSNESEGTTGRVPDWATNLEIVYSMDGKSAFAVARTDFPNTMTWEEAKQACENLGNGWRLPDQDELVAMYEQLHKEGKGNFSDYWYWSSSQDDSGNAWYVNFGSGGVDNLDKINSGQVRAVRAF